MNIQGHALESYKKSYRRLKTMNTLKNYYIDGLKKVAKNLDYTAEEVKTADFNNMSKTQMILENKEYLLYTIDRLQKILGNNAFLNNEDVYFLNRVMPDIADLIKLVGI